jgi:NAD(P)-dependent dehydrogenase (short-subunit alcohol dehydrogenase family)
MEPDMEQRVALITGASQGLGRALAEALADRGWSLVLDARRADRLDRAASELATRTKVVAIAGDVTDPEHRDRLVHAVHDLGRLDLLVNNASTLGASPLPALESIGLDVLRRTYEVNVIAPLALTQQLLGPLVESRGTIVNVTSDAAVEAYPEWGGYGSSKAAFEHLSAVLAVEQPEVRVLVTDPGDMRTEMHQDAFPGEDISDRPLPDAIVPALVELIESDQGGGRYRVPELVS